MSLTSWLRKVRSYCGIGPTNRKSRRAARCEPPKRTRLQLEHLEDRCLPSFSPAVAYEVGTSPAAIVSADFNNDGHLDLATANPAALTVSVLLGDGRGGFGAAIDSLGSAYGGLFNHASLAVTDFNNDGNLDLAVAYAYYDRDPNGYWPSGSLSVLLGNGNGTFQAPTFQVSPYGGPNGEPVSAAVGDFNNDGNSDLVVTGDDLDSYGTVQVLLGTGQGGFTRAPWVRIANVMTSVTVADLNCDGNLDAVAAAPAMSSSGDGYALLGDGDGTFRYDGRWWEYPQFGGMDDRGVAVGDFTGDGIPDWVTAGQTVNVFIGSGDGRYNSMIIGSASGAMHTGVAVADFNGDGMLDAVTSDGDTGTVSELLGNGNGTLTYAAAFATGSSPSAVAVGDFNGDGRPDVAAANSGSNTVSVLLNDGTWTPPPPAPPTVRIGDVSVTEGNTGTTAANFSVTLSAPSTETITVVYATSSGSATAGSDYQATSGTLTFAPGEISKTIGVLVNGDRIGESNENFVINLSGATNANIGDGQGVGTIVDDEPRIRINDVTKAEGKNNQTTLFTFTVTLSVAYDVPVTLNFATSDGTAKTSDNDYVATSGTITFAPGETTKTITVVVKGDKKKESIENFFVDLSDLSNYAVFLDSRGTGTIQNDD